MSAFGEKMSALGTVDISKLEVILKIICDRLQKWRQHYATSLIRILFPRLPETCFVQDNVWAELLWV